MLQLRLPSAIGIFCSRPARKPAMPSSFHRWATPFRLVLEELESRDLPSVAGVFAVPNLTQTPAKAAPNDSSSSFIVYSPAQIRAAYGFDQLSENGAGQTIAIVDAYDDPNLASDLATFDQSFNLPGQNAAGVASFLTKVNEYGNPSASSLPQGNRNWAIEITLDVEWAHAMAPGAHILLVEASSSSGADLLTAVNSARYTAGVSVVSMSWGTSEFYGENTYDGYFTTPAGHIGGNNQSGGITFVASSGDNGAWYGPEWPSVSPNVLAVGGTSLTISGYAYEGETGWSGSGGGYSRYEARPNYQVGANNIPWRSTPDVAYNADPNTGYYFWSTYMPSGSGWFRVGGTSAGAPQWAAIIALADEGRAAQGLPSLSGAQSDIYSLPSSDFHDITSGYNGYMARVGYDTVTGLGSPYANRVVNDLLLVPGDPGYHPLTNTSGTTEIGHPGGKALEGESDFFSGGVNLLDSPVSSTGWGWWLSAGQGQENSLSSASEPALPSSTVTNANPANEGTMPTLFNLSGEAKLSTGERQPPVAPTTDGWSAWQWSMVGSGVEAAME